MTAASTGRDGGGGGGTGGRKNTCTLCRDCSTEGRRQAGGGGHCSGGKASSMLNGGLWTVRRDATVIGWIVMHIAYRVLYSHFSGTACYVYDILCYKTTAWNHKIELYMRILMRSLAWTARLVGLGR